MRSDRGKHDMIYTKAGEILKKNGPCIKTEADELVCIKVSQALFKAVVKHSLTTAFFVPPVIFILVHLVLTRLWPSRRVSLGI